MAVPTPRETILEMGASPVSFIATSVANVPTTVLAAASPINVSVLIFLLIIEVTPSKGWDEY